MILGSSRYPFLVRWVHWSSVLLVLLAYLTSDAAEDQSGGAAQLHVLAGLLLVVLFVPRLMGYVLRRRGAPLPHESDAGTAARIATATVHVALLLFVIVQPLLGILALWGEGQALPVPFTSWAVPSPLATSGPSELFEDLHETVGNIFYAVIGLHVAASLWHHFLRRDGVLRRML